MDSILFDNESDKSVCASEEDQANTDDTLPGLLTCSRLHPKNINNRTTRCPRSASQNVQYTGEPEENVLIVKNQTGYVKNIKPSASCPPDECVRAQSKHSEQPSSSLPGLPIHEVHPHDGETEPDLDVPVETSNKTAAKASESSPKKGSISIMSHTL